jgi:hypothetical protein
MTADEEASDNAIIATDGLVSMAGMPFGSMTPAPSDNEREEEEEEEVS